MVQMHPRKKIDIIVETAILPRVEATLLASSVKGYTVVQCLKGHGAQGDWSEDEFSQADRMVIVTAILTREALDPVLENLRPLLDTWRCVVSVSDVEVLRPQKF